MAEGVFTSGISFSCPLSIPVDLPCRLCKKQVYQNGKLSSRYYGLLDCEHPFCLKCIRCFIVQRLQNCVRQRAQNPEWDNVICPVCWRPSSCIVASRELTVDPEKKNMKFNAFKQVVSDFQCPFIRQGVGWCFCIGENHSFTYTLIYDNNLIVNCVPAYDFPSF